MFRRPRSALSTAVLLVLLLAISARPSAASWTDCITDPAQEALASCTAMLRVFPEPGHFWAIALRKRSIAHFELKNYADAISDSGTIITVGYGLAEDFERRSNAYTWLNDWEKALADARQAHRMDPQSETVRWSLAVAELEMGHYGEAVQHLNALKLAYPRDADIESKLGLAHDGLGETEKALEFYRQATILKPEDSWRWLDRGILEFELDLNAESEKSLGEALRLDPRNSDAFYWRAWQQYLRNDYARAAADIGAAIAIDPQARYKVLRGFNDVASGNLDAAQKELDGLWASGGSDDTKYQLRGRIEAARDDHAAAVKSFEEAIARDSKNTAALFDSAKSYRALGENEKADQRFSATLARWTTNAEVFYLRAGVRLDLGNIEEALADAEAAVKFDPAWAAAYARRSQVHMRKLLYVNAEADCRKALTIDAAFVDARIDCAWAAWNLDGLERALADYDILLKRFPEDTGLIGERAELLYALNRRAEAFEEAERAVKMTPSSATALLHRGSIMEQDGRYQAAFSDYSRAIGIDPENAWGYEARAYWYLGEDLIANAMADCRVMMAKLPKAPASYRCMARTAREGGEIADALAWLDKAREMNVNYGPAYYDRAVIQRENGLYEDALQLFGKAVSLSYRKADSLILRGDTHFDLGDMASALKDYRAAAGIARGWRIESARSRITAIENRTGASGDDDRRLYPGRGHRRH